MMNNQIIANDGKFSFFTGGEQPVKVSDGYIDVVIVDVSKVERYYVSRKSVGDPAYKQHLLVIDPRKLEDGTATENDMFTLIINAASMFDSGSGPGGHSLRDYLQCLQVLGSESPQDIRYSRVVTRIKFKKYSAILSHLGFSSASSDDRQIMYLSAKAQDTLSTFKNKTTDYASLNFLNKKDTL